MNNNGNGNRSLESLSEQAYEIARRRKAAANEVESAAAPRPKLGNSTSRTNDSQNAPYEKKARVPKLLPFFHSRSPTTICAIPP